MPSTDLTNRVAIANDADAIARVFSPSLRLLTFLPELHTVEEESLVHREYNSETV